MGRPDLNGSPSQRLALYALLSCLLLIAVNPAMAEISTSECAWPTSSGSQRGDHCASCPGPENPSLVFSRRFDFDEYFSWPYIDGIGPNDIVATHCYTSDAGSYPMHMLILHSDGHLILSESGGGHRVRALDNERAYISDGGNLVCYRYDGSQQWMLEDAGSSITPLNDRGVAVWINNGTNNQSYLDIYGEEGELKERIPLIPAYTRGTRYYNVYNSPVFDGNGLAVWKVSWHEPNPYGGGTGGSTLYYEKTDDWVDYDGSSSYPGEDYECYNISKSGFMTTYLDDILVWTGDYAALYSDPASKTATWRDSFEGYGYPAYGYACSDPSGACSFLIYQCDFIDDFTDDKYLTFEIMHSERDGSSWTRVLDEWDPQDWRIDQDDLKVHGLICDSLGNLYMGVRGHVLSYTPDGELRWDFHLSNDDVEVAAIDSRGTLYVARRTHITSRLFALSDRDPERPKVRAKLVDVPSDQMYRPGYELRLSLHPYNFGWDETVDCYIAVQLPDDTWLFRAGGGWTDAPTPWLESLLLPNSFEMMDFAVDLGTIPQGTPDGLYTIFVGFSRPGTLEPVSELYPVEFRVSPVKRRS
ncbi:MAG: hypothetical protein JW941_01805 [Candidatus Coatesbacteria bacterium]|nr:hypothetical protein [Candidatus Coatesbacteria bacterium]